MAVGVPPSVLPDIPPSQGEIGLGARRRSSPPLWGRWRQPEGVFAASTEPAERKIPPQPSPQGGGRATVVPHPLSPLEGDMSAKLTDRGTPCTLRSLVHAH